MTRILKTIGITATLALALVIFGCETEEEPIEETGEAIEEAAEETGEALEESAEETGEAIEEAAEGRD